MKKIYLAIFSILLITSQLFAKTYILTSGKWTDPELWGDNYRGAMIKSGDVVIITGTIVINTPVIVEGTLQVEKGASMVGSKDLTISQSGTFINNGNTVMNHIINEGTIMNTMSMDAINNIDNTGHITNTSNMVAGNDFNNSGIVEGKKSTYFVQNNLVSSALSKFGSDLRFFCSNTLEVPAPSGGNSTSFSNNNKEETNCN